jgi:hypothetical protein
MYDEEGRLKSFRVNSKGASSDDDGIAESNSLYSTDAELFGTITPFLKKNRIRDAQRRNYVIQPGGACIYWKEDNKLADPYAHGRVQFTAPGERETFGHNTQPDGSVDHHQGRRFTISPRGDKT